MNEHRSMTPFYLETVLIGIIFVLVISVLAQAFSQARIETQQAEKLTNAVCLAQNAAEAVGAADSKEALAQLLSENGNTELRENEPGQAAVYAFYNSDMQPVTKEEASLIVARHDDEESVLLVRTTWEPSESDTGTFVNSDIAVYCDASTKPLYTLHTGAYLKKDKPAAGLAAEQEGRR